MNTQEYISQVQVEFTKLFEAAEKKNLLYYLLTLFTELPSLRWNSLFVAQVNEVTSRLVYDRARQDNATAVPAHEMLLALQINLEAKSVYAVIRNIAFVVVGRPSRPEPWDKRRGDYRLHRNGQVAMSTGAILRNTIEDLRVAGADLLADRFEQTHVHDVGHIRNAIAHSMFRFPGEETGGKWVFGSYAESTPGFLQVDTREYTHDEFQEVCRRFFGFRLGFALACEQSRSVYAQKTFEFRAENQMKLGEMLDCKLTPDGVEVKYKGTPLW
jgi:hypothetical protein